LKTVEGVRDTNSHKQTDQTDDSSLLPLIPLVVGLNTAYF